jgi:hypothetical protein
MDLDECIRKGFVKKTRIDKELIKSIIEISDIKEMTIKSASIDNINISAYVPMAYDSLREIMEAICITKGYKVTSHICIGELLRDYIGESDYKQFDRLRYVRNSINYYGVRVGFVEGEEIIEKILGMRKRFKERYLKGVF